MNFDISKEPEVVRKMVEKMKKQEAYTAEEYKLALFNVVRNSAVMPKGIALGKSKEEINQMSWDTVKEIMKVCDFDILRETFKGVKE